MLKKILTVLLIVMSLAPSAYSMDTAKFNQAVKTRSQLVGVWWYNPRTDVFMWSRLRLREDPLYNDIELPHGRIKGRVVLYEKRYYLMVYGKKPSWTQSEKILKNINMKLHQPIEYVVDNKVSDLASALSAKAKGDFKIGVVK